MMTRPMPMTMAFTLLVTAPVAAQEIPLETQVALAVQAAPEAMRADATVQGYDADGSFITIREGSNELICMAPNPASESFEVSCHHEALEPYFARGRELRAEGMAPNAATQQRWEEVDAGTLDLPYGAINYILHGAGFDAATNEIQEPFLRWVIYTPGATPETTGISAQPAVPGAPWLMFAGTPGSHIMIVPPREGG